MVSPTLRFQVPSGRQSGLGSFLREGRTNHSATPSSTLLLWKAIWIAYRKLGISIVSDPSNSGDLCWTWVTFAFLKFVWRLLQRSFATFLLAITLSNPSRSWNRFSRDFWQWESGRIRGRELNNSDPTFSSHFESYCMMHYRILFSFHCRLEWWFWSFPTRLKRGPRLTTSMFTTVFTAAAFGWWPFLFWLEEDGHSGALLCLLM